MGGRAVLGAGIVVGQETGVLGTRKSFSPECYLQMEMVEQRLGPLLPLILWTQLWLSEGNEGCFLHRSFG